MSSILIVIIHPFTSFVRPVQGNNLMESTTDSADGDLHELVDEDATQRVSPHEDVFTDGKRDENVDLKHNYLTSLKSCSLH